MCQKHTLDVPHTAQCLLVRLNSSRTPPVWLPSCPHQRIHMCPATQTRAGRHGTENVCSARVHTSLRAAPSKRLRLASNVISALQRMCSCRLENSSNRTYWYISAALTRWSRIVAGCVVLQKAQRGGGCVNIQGKNLPQYLAKYIGMEPYPQALL